MWASVYSRKAKEDMVYQDTRRRMGKMLAVTLKDRSLSNALIHFIGNLD